MTKSLSQALSLSAISLLLTLSGCNNNSDNKTFAEPIPEVVDFNFDVKPILSDTCYLCHGPDKENARAGLTLSNFADATAHTTDSGLKALLPGNPDDSEAFMRIISDDPNYMMPPPSANLTLSARDKAIIKKWIEQGAEYKKHWALIKPEKTEVPTVKSSAWVNNPIDAFIAQKAEQQGLALSEQADKESLIRRVTFDLTGLPPTLAEIDNFLNDNSANAYETVVERLLASPHYGERMAVEWLDVARYADTHGYSTDFYRDMSPYRDWVINSFNNNRPFDEFITWQIAGDLLKNSTAEQTLATAFNRIHAQNGEGGIVNEEFRVEYVKDRVQTIGTGLLGLTMHCAQCHDHKYDPISAKDYYSMTAFFNSIDESGQISYDADDMPVPTMLMPTEEQTSNIAVITEQVRALEQAIKTRHDHKNPAFTTWLRNKKAKRIDTSNALLAYFPLENTDSNTQIANKVKVKDIGRVIYNSDPKKKEGEPMVHINDEGRDAIQLNGDDPLYFPSLNTFESATPFTISIDAKIPNEITDGVLFHYNKGGILYNFKGFDVGIEGNHWLVRFAHTYPYNAIVLKSTAPVLRNEWQNVTLTYDGSGTLEGIQLFLDGQVVPTDIVRNNLYKDIKHNKAGVLKEIGLKVGARWRSRGLPNSLVDNLKVYNQALSRTQIAGTFNHATEDELLALFNNQYNKQYHKDLAQLTALRKQKNALKEQVSEVMVMKEMATPRQAYILERGSYASHGEPVSPGVPEAILPFDKSWPQNRVGLAKWFTSPDHPLVARVITNRYWQMFFANGLVRTPEDFGNQGRLPSHPALLDWLAREFVDSGWNIKQLVKMLVMSATYQQTSKVTAEVAEIDPENIFLTRAPTSRLSAEMIRDMALKTSGLLVTTIGGKSVHPYQPEGIWRMNNMDYQQGTGNELYRRSMYTIYKRSVPPPNMTAFDSPTRSYSVGVRQETNTPLQSLALLNDPQIVEASRVLAEKVMLETPTSQAQLANIYRILTSRTPNEKEIEVITVMYNDMLASFSNEPERSQAFLAVGEHKSNNNLDNIALAALTSVTNMLMNHDAAVIKR